MQRADRIYEEPSPLARALVVGLSIAVVLMAGWFSFTIMSAQPAMTVGSGNADTPVAPPAAATESRAAGVSNAPRPAARSVHFDWPSEFDSSAAPSAPPPARTAPTLTSAEAPASPGLGALGPWPVAAPDARDRGLSLSTGAATAATDAIMDVLTPPPSRTAGAGRELAPAAPPQRQAQQRRPKTRAADGAVAQ